MKNLNLKLRKNSIFKSAKNVTKSKRKKKKLKFENSCEIGTCGKWPDSPTKKSKEACSAKREDLKKLPKNCTELNMEAVKKMNFQKKQLNRDTT